MMMKKKKTREVTEWSAQSQQFVSTPQIFFAENASENVSVLSKWLTNDPAQGRNFKHQILQFS